MINTKIDNFFQGEQAYSKFQNCINSFYQDDSTGTIKAYKRKFSEPILIDFDPSINFSVQYLIDISVELVIIDSGNIHGDSWKYIFHPLTLTGIFLHENI